MTPGFADLKLGSATAEVGNWQRFLTERGFFDHEGKPPIDDEMFGPRTLYATKSWQARNQLPMTGIISVGDRKIAQDQGFIPFLQARNCTLIYPKKRGIDVIVIHTMENDEKPDSAENVALWFAGLTRYQAPIASAHYNIDEDSVVQSVRDMDVAWHAPGANHDGIGLEHAGRARQTRAEWHDEKSERILDRSAWLAARLVRRYRIPIVKLTSGELRAGERGFCAHADATLAFPGPGRTHWDPGANFPWGAYLDRILNLISRPSSTPVSRP